MYMCISTRLQVAVNLPCSAFHTCVCSVQSGLGVLTTPLPPSLPSLPPFLSVIGDEILKGHIQDTNSHYLCHQLWLLGVKVGAVSTHRVGTTRVVIHCNEAL